MYTKPRRLFVMRHAESLEDIDKTAYERIADEDMPLSAYGREQATDFGSRFVSSFGSCQSLRLILSPSKRVLETAEILVSKLPTNIKWSLATESLIAKQNWGNVTIHNRPEIEKERYRTGVLRYQFPGGESGEEMLFRFDLFAKRLSKEMAELLTDEAVLIISHGFEMRITLKSLLGWTEDHFESMAHPQHCEIKRLAFDRGSFVLLDEMVKYDHSRNPDFIRRQSMI